MSTEYRIFETKGFLRDLDAISPDLREELVHRLQRAAYPEIRRNPYQGDHIRKLKDWDPPTWRYRIGPWRIVYEISRPEMIVYLTGIADRKEAY